MKVRKRKLQVGDELGVEWERWADGQAWRLKRKQFPEKYIWLQFADGKIRAGEPCPCGSRRLLRLHTHFVKCPECGAMLLQGQPGDADETDSRPALRLGQVKGLHLARLGRTGDVDVYRGYGEKDVGPVLVLAEFRVDGAEQELSPENALERADRVVTIPLEQLSDLFDISAFSDSAASHWDLVF